MSRYTMKLNLGPLQKMNEHIATCARCHAQIKVGQQHERNGGKAFCNEECKALHAAIGPAPRIEETAHPPAIAWPVRHYYPASRE